MPDTSQAGNTAAAADHSMTIPPVMPAQSWSEHVSS
jgi:hypothetical protein